MGILVVHVMAEHLTAIHVFVSLSDNKDVDARHKAEIVGDGSRIVRRPVANRLHFAAVHTPEFFASEVAIE